MPEKTTEDSIQTDNFDRGIVPAETAARKEREGEDYKKTSDKEGDLGTTGGQTVSNEGLANNYAIEPEMYVEEPGDLSEDS
jgi:hypothetical protein